MHANIELRTAHLHRALDKELQRLRRENGTNIGVIVLGGGYDTRGIQLALQDRVDRVYELDLPAVVQSKRYMLERAIGTNRLSTLTENDRFLLEAVDLNHEKAFDKVLDKILADLKQRQQAWYTIVISEALFLYLDPGVPGRILKRIGQKFQNEKGGGASFLFADKLELKEVEQADSTKTSTPIATETQMKNWLLQYGWKLQELKIKQGATRHLGIAML
jgi:O-methyltransferase involved in polyketide biosynthesis